MNKLNNYKTTIGLEIHVQLKTKTKMFCRCSNRSEEAEPNTNVCPICLGMPGTLPATNKQAVSWTARTGLALNCSINSLTKFDRKHYFYPDLPKGFQISQYDQPIAKDGYLITSGDKQVGINRVHLEEDAGKLIHPQDSQDSLVDLNRAGTPLMEVVSEPDITTPAQAKEFLRLLKYTVIYLGVSDASMEKGHLRVDANISVQKGQETTNIIEVKNMNSFRAVEQALIYEQKRLRDNFNKFKNKKQKETRGWSPETKQTKSQRTKEEAADYRYFPEPDIPPISFEKGEIDSIKSDLPKLPSRVREEFTKSKMTDEDFWSLIKSPRRYQFYVDVLEQGEVDKKELVNWLVNENVSVEIKPKYFAQFILLREKGKLPGPLAKKVLQLMEKEKISPKEIISKLDLSAQTGDKLQKMVDQVIVENESVVEDYQSGKESAIQFLIGQVMTKVKGQANPQEVKKILENKID